MTDYAYRLLNVFTLDGNRLSGTKEQKVFEWVGGAIVEPRLRRPEELTRSSARWLLKTDWQDALWTRYSACAKLPAWPRTS